VAGLLEANGIYNVKLLVNRVRPDMIQSNDMMSVKDVQVRWGVAGGQGAAEGLLFCERDGIGPAT
jgi:hypothetical protein